MVNKHYPVEFKADAVALYRSRPGASIASIADDLGVNRETLRSWVRLDDERRGAAGPRQADDIRTGVFPELRDEPGGSPSIGQVVSGMQAT
jgi:transposase